MRRFAGTHHRTSERGTVLLMATVTILIVVGMLALAVDVGYLMNGRGQLQNALDASALAAAQGLRVAIEPAGVKAEQVKIVRNLAKDFALFNPMRRADGTNGLTLADSDIEIQEGANPGQPARVIVKHRLAFPTIFGNVFGISSMNISAVAIASTTVVDGGTGFVSGCWRPILIPDTFFDKDNQVWAICDPDVQVQGGGKPCRATGPPNQNPTLALQDGDRYASRFASINSGSSRNQITNFLQVWPPNSSMEGEATSIRDANNQGELKYVNGVLTGRNLIGQRMHLRYSQTNPDRCDWRIINFEASGITGNFPSDPVQQINKGCCTQIRVGQLVQVYDDPTFKHLGLYQNFIQQLQNYRNSAVGKISSPSAQQYRYAQTDEYPTPNASPLVIPVLFCSPIQFSLSSHTSQFYVTNIGAFYLEAVSPGSLVGYFVREVVTGGTPLQPESAVANTSFLPVSVNLVR
jgi:hypothetical protein